MAGRTHARRRRTAAWTRPRWRAGTRDARARRSAWRACTRAARAASLAPRLRARSRRLAGPATGRRHGGPGLQRAALAARFVLIQRARAAGSAQLSAMACLSCLQCLHNIFSLLSLRELFLFRGATGAAEKHAPGGARERGAQAHLWGQPARRQGRRQAVPRAAEGRALDAGAKGGRRCCWSCVSAQAGQRNTCCNTCILSRDPLRMKQGSNELGPADA